MLGAKTKSNYPSPPQIRKPAGRPNWPLAAFLTAYCVIFTAAYLTFKNVYIHEVRTRRIPP